MKLTNYNIKIEKYRGKLSSFLNTPIIILGKLKLTRFTFINTFFWNQYSTTIDKSWGNSTGNYERISQIINKYNINSVLDIGAGSGRLLPLFLNHKMRITLQDISEKAKSLCRSKYGSEGYEYLVCNILGIQNVYDLVTSNKVLSAIHPNDIHRHISKLCELSNYIYVSESFKAEEKTNYWFQHAYVEIFSKYGFKVVMSNDKEWILFMKLCESKGVLANDSL